MKKILIATGLYPPESGGPATYSRLIEERLPAHGFDVSVLPFRAVRHLPKIFRHSAYFFKVLQSDAHIVYALDTVSVGLPSALASKLSGKKFLVRVPGDYAWEQGRQRFGVTDEIEAFQTKKYSFGVECLRTIQKFVVNRAQVVIVPSDFMLRIVSGWTNPSKVHRIYTSIELPPPYELPKNLPEGFVVLSIARPVPWKGLDGLKRATERESAWTLKIVNDLPYKEAMGWIKAASVFVINSTYEGLSHLLVEAMSLGTPVIATRVGGNPELITDGIDGILIEPKNDDELYAAIKKVADDNQATETRVHAAQEKVKQFSIDVAITKLSELLRTV